MRVSLYFFFFMHQDKPVGLESQVLGIQLNLSSKMSNGLGCQLHALGACALQVRSLFLTRLCGRLQVVSMSEAVTALQAENSCLRTRLDDLAKRLGAVEDYSGDDEAQNMPLRR